MGDFIEFDLDGDTTVFVESESSDGDFERMGGDGTEKKRRKFLDVIEGIKPAAEAVLTTFRGMDTPEEIGLEFGIKFNAKAGVFGFASVDSEATFKVSLRWNNKPDKIDKQGKTNG